MGRVVALDAMDPDLREARALVDKVITVVPHRAVAGLLLRVVVVPEVRVVTAA